MGDFTVELDEESAPVSSKNFLSYVDEGFFDGTVFHRVIPGFMVQGGGFTPDMEQKSGHAPITNEADNGLRKPARHARDGAHERPAQRHVAVLRQPGRQRIPRSQTGSFGYAVFGRVVGGMDVIDKIAKVKTGRRRGHDDVPAEPVVIKLVRRASAA